MKPIQKIILFILLVLAVVLAGQKTNAQSTDTWQVGTDNTFATAANWTLSSGSGPVAKAS
jgi:hypothetical protein